MPSGFERVRAMQRRVGGSRPKYGKITEMLHLVKQVEGQLLLAFPSCLVTVSR